jgi:hypothetical protein
MARPSEAILETALHPKNELRALHKYLAVRAFECVVTCRDCFQKCVSRLLGMEQSGEDGYSTVVEKVGL